MEVAKVVHALLVNAQCQRLAFAQRVHEEFGALSTEGANAEAILTRAALPTAEPVVLEDPAHRALSFAARGDVRAGALLRD